MKESIGFTVSLNIMIVFITVVIAFLCAALIYFKSHKVNNIITSSIEKYEGYNANSQSEINENLTSLGYGSHSISCDLSISERGANSGVCNLVGVEHGRETQIDNQNVANNNRGYCVYKCVESDDYYYYKIRTNMMINIPVINNILDVPIWTTTNRLYDFTK